MFHEAGFLNVKVKVILLLSAEHSAGSKNVIQKVTLQTPVDFVESLCYKDFYALFSCPEQKKIFPLLEEEEKWHVFKQWLVRETL